jgi:tetratricopeptide (TPR) repeat protein
MIHSMYKISAGLAVTYLLALSIGSMPLSGQVNDQAASLEQAKALMKQPLDVVQIRGKSQSNMRLTGIENEQVIFQIGNGMGEASIPLDQLGEISFRILVDDDYNKVIGAIATETLNRQQLNIIRARNFPMVRFLPIPPENSIFHEAVKKLFEALILAESYEEALLLLQNIDLNKLDPEFEQLAIRLSGNLVDQKAYELASATLEAIPIESINLANLNAVLTTAGTIRDHGNYEYAKALYDRLAINPESRDLEATYWSYYCGIYLGMFKDDHLFQQQVERIKPGEPLFSLQQLILGTYYLKREQFPLAMRTISEGVAYARPIDPWIAELMYRSGVAYEAIEEIQTAAAVYDETAKFFPNSNWSKLAREAYERIQLQH